jgi:hypothetical protein
MKVQYLQGRNRKIFRLVFGSNENCIICFRDYLTFTGLARPPKTKALPGFCRIESGGGSGGMPMMWPALWPCLPKIGRGDPDLPTTMVSVSTVQLSINLEFLCTNENLKISLYTLFKKNRIYRVSYMKSYA